MNFEKFYNEINDLPTNHKNRDLEEYLLAIYGKVLEYKEEKLTYDLVIKIIAEAFTSSPVEFKEEWLNCNTAPDENIISKKFTNPEFSQSIDKTNYSKLEPFEFTIETLKFQIAELHKMRGKQLENEERYFGVNSETGHRWYNFDPFGNLECGVNCMNDNDEDAEILDWSFIGVLLENGRIYE